MRSRSFDKCFRTISSVVLVAFALGACSAKPHIKKEEQQQAADPNAAARHSKEGQWAKACEGDAIKLCFFEIPNKLKITRCMIRKKPKLSPGCAPYFKKITLADYPLPGEKPAPKPASTEEAAPKEAAPVAKKEAEPKKVFHPPAKANNQRRVRRAPVKASKPVTQSNKNPKAAVAKPATQPPAQAPSHAPEPPKEAPKAQASQVGQTVEQAAKTTATAVENKVPAPVKSAVQTAAPPAEQKK